MPAAGNRPTPDRSTSTARGNQASGGNNARLQNGSFMGGSSPAIPQHLLWDESRLKRRRASPLTERMKRIKLEEEEINLDSPSLFRMALQEEEEESSSSGSQRGSRAQTVSGANMTPGPRVDLSQFIDPNRPDIEYL